MLNLKFSKTILSFLRNILLSRVETLKFLRFSTCFRRRWTLFSDVQRREGPMYVPRLNYQITVNDNAGRAVLLKHCDQFEVPSIFVSIQRSEQSLTLCFFSSMSVAFLYEKRSRWVRTFYIFFRATVQPKLWIAMQRQDGSDFRYPWVVLCASARPRPSLED